MGNIVKIISAAICAVLGFLFGHADGMLYALLAFMAIDYISGVIIAIIRKELSSEVGFKGIAKKIFMLMLVAVGHILDAYVIGDGDVFRNGVTGFYIANEGISILENAGVLIPLPKKLLDILAQLRDKEDK